MILAFALAGAFLWLMRKGFFAGRALPAEVCAKTIANYSSLGLAACLAVMSIIARWVGPEFVHWVSVSGLSFGEVVLRLSLITFSNWLVLLVSSLCPLFVPANLNLLNGSGLSVVLGPTLVFLLAYTVLNYFVVIALVSVLAVQKVQFKASATPSE
jgi:hypothetical protein